MKGLRLVVGALLLLFVSHTSSSLPRAAATERDEVFNLPLRSVLLRDRDVFASNTEGIYRASLDTKVWHRLSTPASLPLGGGFARQPADSRLVFYFAYNPSGSEVPGKRFGLYLSTDDGMTWRLVSEASDYGPVFLHPNGKLFAVRNAPARVFVSSDLGVSWREISKGVSGQVLGIFVDPDHPDQICLGVNGMRNYVLHAADERYEWVMTRQWDWRAAHMSDESFLFPAHSSRTTFYVLPATLSNYFSFGFENEVMLPRLAILTDAPRYEFRKGQLMRVRVSLGFLDSLTGVKPTWLADRTPPSERFFDSQEGLELWALRVVDPQGKRVTVEANASTTVYTAPDRAAATRELWRTAGFQPRYVTEERGYSRVIDLARLYDFAVTGTYRIRITYDSIWLKEEPEAGDWLGTVSAPVIEVHVSE